MNLWSGSSAAPPPGRACLPSARPSLIETGMDVREARFEDADEACLVMRRSIAELCGADHHGDPPLLAAWLANKTPKVSRHGCGGPTPPILSRPSATRLRRSGP